MKVRRWLALLLLVGSASPAAGTLAPPAQQVLHHGNGAEPNSLDPHRSGVAVIHPQPLCYSANGRKYRIKQHCVGL